MNNNEEPIITIKVKKHPLHKKKLIIRPPQPQISTISTISTIVVEEQPEPQIQTIQKTIEQEIEQYISQLNNQERIVLKIATEHLKSSFDIEKSIGFKNWQKKL